MAGRYSKELLELPTQPAAAELVLKLVENPRSTADQLARVVETDLALSARIIRLANSPYYGAARRVSSVQQAVVLLGFSTVRALAVSAACSLLDAEGDPSPTGFWRHAVTTAAACSVAARRIGFSTADAFSAGLLHDIGAVLLYRRNPEKWMRTQQAGTTMSAILAAELRAFGQTHAQAGAEAVEAWSFPPSFVEAVSTHHGSEEPQHALGRLVRVAEALALEVERAPGHPEVVPVEKALPTLHVPLAQRDELLAEVRDYLSQMAEFLGVRQ